MPPWEVALGVTLLIEVPIVAACFPGQRVRMATFAALTNVATNLSLNLLLWRIPLIAPSYLLVGEAMALVLEALVYARVSRPRDPPRALVASATANILSFGVGGVLASILTPQ